MGGSTQTAEDRRLAWHEWLVTYRSGIIVKGDLLLTKDATTVAAIGFIVYLLRN